VISFKARPQARVGVLVHRAAKPRPGPRGPRSQRGNSPRSLKGSAPRGAGIHTHGLLQNPVVDPEIAKAGKLSGYFLGTIGETAAGANAPRRKQGAPSRLMVTSSKSGKQRFKLAAVSPIPLTAPPPRR